MKRCHQHHLTTCRSLHVIAKRHPGTNTTKQLATRRTRARSRFASYSEKLNRPNFAALAELSLGNEEVSGKSARYPAAVLGTPADKKTPANLLCWTIASDAGRICLRARENVAKTDVIFIKSLECDSVQSQACARVGIDKQRSRLMAILIVHETKERHASTELPRVDGRYVAAGCEKFRHGAHVDRKHDASWASFTVRRRALQVQKARDPRQKHTPQTQEQCEARQRQKIQNKPEPFEDNCASRMCAGNMN